MKTKLYIATFFLFAGLVGVSQEQANVQFSVRVADFQSIHIKNNGAAMESSSIKALENNTIKILGTSPYELQLHTQSISEVSVSTDFENNTSLTISSHDEYDNTSTINALTNNEAKIVQSSKTSLELFYNLSDFLLTTSQVAPTQVIAYTLVPN